MMLVAPFSEIPNAPSLYTVNSIVYPLTNTVDVKLMLLIVIIESSRLYLIKNANQNSVTLPDILYFIRNAQIKILENLNYILSLKIFKSSHYKNIEAYYQLICNLI